MSWWKRLNPVKNTNFILAKEKIFNGVKGRVREKEPLAKHTTFKIGGAAEFFIEPQDPVDLKLLLNLLKSCKIAPLLIGAGSNLLVADKGVDSAVLRLSSPYFREFRFRNGYLEAASGAMLNQVIVSAQRKGLSGLEFLAGIPGTIGGALAMNAGIPVKARLRHPTACSIADLVEKVRVMDYNGNIEVLDKKEIRFGYRESSLARYIILGAKLKLLKKDKKEIETKIKAYIDYRKDTQDANWHSAGCIFKNPKGESAGRLIDLCGLKGRKFGGARISLKHANFIINTGQAKARDVMKLMNLMRAEVREKFNIDLKPEIEIWK